MFTLRTQSCGKAMFSEEGKFLAMDRQPDREGLKETLPSLTSPTRVPLKLIARYDKQSHGKATLFLITLASNHPAL